MANQDGFWTSGVVLAGLGIVLVGALMILQSVLFEGDRLSATGRALMDLL